MIRYFLFILYGFSLKLQRISQILVVDAVDFQRVLGPDCVFDPAETFVEVVEGIFAC
jgi:hypothetical protein